MEQKRNNSLIALFKEKRVLRYPTDLHFKDRNTKHDAWAELAVDVNMDTSEVEKTIPSLIGQFQCELKKGKSGFAVDAPYNSKWAFFKRRLFPRDKY
ncbi:hypothetical protein PR048_024799 [Dryococelus australis]|uniref:MADF domain-containing protein n=1 Tax=Dryococelus australis TaxID=614101 RepID=A0ABQ9GPP1_9NEOP|nr:hypothetical protein PR048_024799 [Dryococelus australis]